MTRKYPVITFLAAAIAILTRTHLGKAGDQQSHVHGQARINVVVEKERATVEFLASAESMYGLEHPPRSTREEQTRAAALALLEKQIANMVIFDPSRTCRFSKNYLAVVTEDDQHFSEDHDREPRTHGGHSEVRAEFAVLCKTSLAGSQLRFEVTKIFPALREVAVQIVSDTQQQGVTITDDVGSITLEK